MAKIGGGHPVNPREPFTCKPISGDLTSNGVQWSDYTLYTDAADQPGEKTLLFHTYEPARSGKIDGKKTDGHLTISITIGLISSAGTPNAIYKVRARNKGGNWVDLFSYQTEAVSVTEEEHTWSGVFPTVADFNSVPFDLQLVVRSSSATNKVKGRIKSSSYISGEFEPGT